MTVGGGEFPVRQSCQALEAAMPAPHETFDIFITHAWRYHDDWTRMGEMLDRHPGLAWRNFSVPWYDPAMDPNTEVGSNFVQRWLESQIIPTVGVIFLGSVYAIKSTRKWLEMEAAMARRHGKPIVGVASFGEVELAGEARRFVDATAPWDAGEIIATLGRLAAAPSS
jgi:MTH538 TIR-like domain (DUF1863)